MDLTHPGRIGVSPQGWARLAAWACLLGLIPSILWRLAMLAGVDTGFAEAEDFRSDRTLTMYVLGLDATELAGGLLCLGLVQRWGEIVPRWVPGLRGRTIHRLVPVVLGGLGAAALYLLFTQMLWVFGRSWLGYTDAWTPTDGMSTAQTTVLALCYAPFVLWPGALTIALVGYWRRRKPVGS